MTTVEENLQKIRENVAHYTPKIIAVTKYFDESKLIEAYEAGIRDFGENRVQDAIEKINKLPKEIRESSCFHLIGHLQTNKVNKAVGFFDYIHSVDSLRLAELINQTALEKGIVQKIFLQVNLANEEQKSGFSKEDLRRDFSAVSRLEAIKIMGLMNIAPIDWGEDDLYHLFVGVKNLQSELKSLYGCEMDELSMGMSRDYMIALKAGATCIRLGRILFK